MKIMLIDDDYLTLDMLHNALYVNGFDCDVYDDSAVAIDSYSQFEYDIVICDYVMPGFNGIEVLIAIKTIYPEAIFIMYSAYPDKGVVKEAFDNGAADFMNKPIEWSSLIELLKFYELAVV